MIFVIYLFYNWYTCITLIVNVMFFLQVCPIFGLQNQKEPKAYNLDTKVGAEAKHVHPWTQQTWVFYLRSCYYSIIMSYKKPQSLTYFFFPDQDSFTVLPKWWKCWIGKEWFGWLWQLHFHYMWFIQSFLERDQLKLL